VLFDIELGWGGLGWGICWGGDMRWDFDGGCEEGWMVEKGGCGW